MLNRDVLEKCLISVAQRQGFTLNGKDLLDIRTRVATTLAANEHYQRQRMNTPTYQWKKPTPPRWSADPHLARQIATNIDIPAGTDSNK